MWTVDFAAGKRGHQPRAERDDIPPSQFPFGLFVIVMLCLLAVGAAKVVVDESRQDTFRSTPDR